MYPGEKFNSISHLVGALLSLVGLGALLAIGVQSGDAWVAVSYAIFGLAAVALYTASALYHWTQSPRRKRLFQHFDHISIFLLIAGTYTPFMTGALWETSGPIILSVVWGGAVVGTLCELYLRGRAAKVGQVIAYLAMGWACAFDVQGMREGLSPGALLWLGLGGVAYTSGVAFYVLGKLGRLPHAHGIWHLFVLAGTAAHFIGIVGYLH